MSSSFNPWDPQLCLVRQQRQKQINNKNNDENLQTEELLSEKPAQCRIHGCKCFREKTRLERRWVHGMETEKLLKSGKIQSWLFTRIDKPLNGLRKQKTGIVKTRNEYGDVTALFYRNKTECVSADEVNWTSQTQGPPRLNQRNGFCRHSCKLVTR